MSRRPRHFLLSIPNVAFFHLFFKLTKKKSGCRVLTLQPPLLKLHTLAHLTGITKTIIDPRPKGPPRLSALIDLFLITSVGCLEVLV